MPRFLNTKDLVIVISLSIIFSYVSWWALFSIQALQQSKAVLRQDIAASLEETQTVTLTNLPSKIILPIIAYFPFWTITFGLIRLFINLERRRSTGSPLQQQTI